MLPEWKLKVDDDTKQVHDSTKVYMQHNTMKPNKMHPTFSSKSKPHYQLQPKKWLAGGFEDTNEVLIF